MSNYPIWWETTITLYNKYKDSQTNIITWYRTQVPNCFYKATGEKSTIGDTVIDTSSIICRIPKNDKYLPPSEWVQLPNDEMTNYFTLMVGDIIVPYELDDYISEYESGHRLSDFLTKYSTLYGSLTIEQIAINTGKGRCNEHYYVRGI